MLRALILADRLATLAPVAPVFAENVPFSGTVVRDLSGSLHTPVGPLHGGRLTPPPPAVA